MKIPDNWKTESTHKTNPLNTIGTNRYKFHMGTLSWI